MERVVDPNAIRKTETIGFVVDGFSNRNRSVPFDVQLLGRAESAPVLRVNKDFVTDCIARWNYSGLVSIVGLNCLSIVKLLWSSSAR